MERKRFTHHYVLHAVLLLFLGFWLCTAITPVNQFYWLLENLLVILFFSILVSTYYWYSFSNFSYILIALFFSLHLLGAHYSYQIPWGSFLFDWIDPSRNNYDRVVHFAYGLLLAIPIREVLRDLVQIRRGWLSLFTVVLIIATGALYELIEMWVAFLMAPDQGMEFLGSQGDEWDAQHDMELAMYGAIVTLMLRFVTTLFLPKKKATNIGMTSDKH